MNDPQPAFDCRATNRQYVARNAPPARPEPIPTPQKRMNFKNSSVGELVTELIRLRVIITEMERAAGTQGMVMRCQILNQGISTLDEVIRRMQDKLNHRGTEIQRTTGGS